MKSEQKYIIGYKWNNNLAEYEYVLCDKDDDRPSPYEYASGDIEWAERTSLHYNIPVPVIVEVKNDN